MLIQSKNPTPCYPNHEPPEDREPEEGRWYHGVSSRGAGALALYRGHGVFEDSDGREIPMSGYDYLVEH